MISITLDVVMAQRKISLNELSERVGVTPANLSILKNSKGKAIRFSTLNALCRVLECQPGDILEYAADGTVEEGSGAESTSRRGDAR
ncbi:MAG: helix-turn-helix transcriptional regulator [Bifidobacteriaceae bacterium]|jgi:putative transcriptional regulator|nr:helix-turn-helix transcriptional regulator [Bifidobacteriaceae bacterium]